MKIYYAYQIVRSKYFMENYAEDTVMEIVNGTTNFVEGMWKLQLKYKEFTELLKTSKCEITRAVALFADLVDRWLLCRESVPIGDWCVLEVEGVDWICFWAAKAIGKPSYLLECKRRTELLNKMESWLLEYHRNNRFVKLTPDGRYISEDDKCEKHNGSAKKPPKDPNFERVCDRSKHLQFMEKCTAEYYGKAKKTKRSNIPNLSDDVNTIASFLEEVNVICFLKKMRPLKDTSFWEHVVPKKSRERDQKGRSP